MGINATPPVVVALVMFFCGCGMVESKKPLSAPAAAVQDKRLEGLWRDAGDKPSGYLYIAYGAHGVGSLISVDKANDILNSSSRKEEQNAVETAQFRFFVTRDGADEYLDLSDEVLPVNGDEAWFPPARPRTYLFVQVHFVTSNEVTYRLIGGEAFADAVKAGKLKGKVYSDDKEHHVADVVLNDSAEHIIAFIKSSRPEQVTISSGTMRKIGGL